MQKNIAYKLFLIILIALTGVSCKSEFEKIRASGDKELVYQQAFNYFEQDEFQRAQALFELIIPQYRGKKELEKIYFTYAYTYYNQGKYILANYYFKNFTTTFPNSDFKEEAVFMEGYANYKMSPNYRLEQTYSNQAIEDFQSFVNTYPTSERVAECNRLIDEMRLKLEKKSFEEAKLYFDLRQYQAATVTFENLLKDFPETTNAEQVRLMIARSAFSLAENSVYEKKQERFETAAKYAQDFIKKFADSDAYKEVQSIHENSIKQVKKFADERYQNQSTRIGS